MFQVTVRVNPSIGGREAVKAENPTLNIYNHNAQNLRFHEYLLYSEGFHQILKSFPRRMTSEGEETGN